MLVIIDNYDSFTYNLVQYFSELGAQVQVFYHDAITVEQISALAPRYLVISPGPGNPDQAGVSLDVIRAFAGKLPILGVCLGHQAIGQAYGAKVVPAEQVMHGKTSLIYHAGAGVFRGLPNPFVATRYHSLVIDKASMRDPCLKMTAWTQKLDGAFEAIMGVQHREYPLYGVQFHPESILTQYGKRLLANFLEQPFGLV